METEKYFPRTAAILPSPYMDMEALSQRATFQETAAILPSPYMETDSFAHAAGHDFTMQALHSQQGGGERSLLRATAILNRPVHTVTTTHI